MIKNSFFNKMFLPLFVVASYLFLYIPIFILIIFSFNSIAFPYKWKSFSLCWYQELFQSSEILNATQNSLIVATCSVALTLILSLFFVLWSSNKKNNNLLSFFYPNLFICEIVLSVGLLSFFVFFNIPLGLTTLIVGHTLLGLGYTIPIVHNSFKSLDVKLIEASFDLGANHRQTFFKIILPLLMPSLIAAGLLVFILSLDDFLMAFFCGGTSAQTLSLYIFSMLRCGVSPVVNALATLMLFVSSLMVIVFCSLRFKTRIW